MTPLISIIHLGLGSHYLVMRTHLRHKLSSLLTKWLQVFFIRTSFVLRLNHYILPFFFIPVSFIFWNFLSVIHPRSLLHLHQSVSSFFSFLIHYVTYTISVYFSWVTCYISWSLASTVYRREHRHNIIIYGCLDCSQRVASHRALLHLVLRWWELLCSCQLSSGGRSAVITVCAVQSVTSMIVMVSDLGLIIYLRYSLQLLLPTHK